MCSSWEQNSQYPSREQEVGCRKMESVLAWRQQILRTKRVWPKFCSVPSVPDCWEKQHKLSSRQKCCVRKQQSRCANARDSTCVCSCKSERFFQVWPVLLFGVSSHRELVWSVTIASPNVTQRINSDTQCQWSVCNCTYLQTNACFCVSASSSTSVSLLQFTINVSTDMRHHRVRLVFQDAPVHNGKKPRLDQGVQVVLDPVHSVRLLDWWHPQYPFSPKA